MVTMVTGATVSISCSISSVFRVLSQHVHGLYVWNIAWFTHSLVPRLSLLPRNNSTYDIHGIIARKEGEPGNEASLLLDTRYTSWSMYYGLLFWVNFMEGLGLGLDVLYTGERNTAK